MADLKISALTASTTPLAGTEVLPIVQSGTTKQVSVANLTAGRAVSMSSATATATGLFGRSTRVSGSAAIIEVADTGMSIINSVAAGQNNWSLIKNTASTNQSNIEFTTGVGVSLTLNHDKTATFTDNVVIGTSGKGIDFSATPGTGTSELLADYEEGTFTPTLIYSGTNTPTYAAQLGRYTKIGRMVQIQTFLAWNENGSTGNVTLGSLPFTSVTSTARAVPSILSYGLLVVTSSVTGFVNSNATTISLFLNDNAATALSATNTDNDQDMYVTVTYEAA